MRELTCNKNSSRLTLRWALIGAVLLTAFFGQSAHAARRVALVVGNAAYTHATRLNNPVNDARDMGQRLERLGFEVVQALDVGSDAFDGAISTFSRKLAGADLALFFYAGHGLQFNGVNYLLPVDTKIEGEFALRRKAVLAQEIIDQMERTAKVSLVFLDACRNNTLLRDLQQSLPEQTRNAASQRGLARMDPRGSNTLIAFATSPNEVAADGVGRNSPFSTALLKHIETPNISVQDMLTSVAGDVLRETNSVQRPEVLSRLTTRVVLHEKVTAPPAPPPTVAPHAASRERDASVAWEAIKDTCDKDRLAVFRDRYGDTFFGDLAKRRVEQAEAGKICTAAIETPRPAAPSVPLPVQDLPKRFADDEASIRSLQSELKRVGCLSGNVDGKWGEASRVALREFGKRVAQSVDDSDPTKATLELLSISKARVCPLVCADGEVLRDGRCVEPPKQKPSQEQPKAVQPPKTAASPKNESCTAKSNIWTGTTCSAITDSCKSPSAGGSISACNAAFRECMATGRWIYRMANGICYDWGVRHKS